MRKQEHLTHYESNYILRLSSNGRSCLKVLLLKRNAFRMKRKSVFARTKENAGRINSRNIKIIFFIQKISFYVQKKGISAEIRQDSGDNSPCISCQVRKIMCLFQYFLRLSKERFSGRIAERYIIKSAMQETFRKK